MEVNFNTNKVSFKAGLTPVLRKEIQHTDCKAVQNIIKDTFETEADFAGNKLLAKLMHDSLNICRQISEKYKLPFDIYPPKIKVYNNQELASYEDVHFGFCIGEKFKVLKKEPEYPVRSVFIKNIKDSASIFNDSVDKWYKMNIISSDSVFLPFLHELMHNIHMKLVFDKSGYDKGLIEMKKMSGQMPSFDRCIIRDEIGEYASKSKAELFPEVVSKLICESMDEDNIITKNPMDNLKNLPEFIRSFIKNQIGIL